MNINNAGIDTDICVEFCEHHLQTGCLYGYELLDRHCKYYEIIDRIKNKSIKPLDYREYRVYFNIYCEITNSFRRYDSFLDYDGGTFVYEYPIGKSNKLAKKIIDGIKRKSKVKYQKDKCAICGSSDISYIDYEIRGNVRDYRFCDVCICEVENIISETLPVYFYQLDDSFD